MESDNDENGGGLSLHDLIYSQQQQSTSLSNETTEVAKLTNNRRRFLSDDASAAVTLVPPSSFSSGQKRKGRSTHRDEEQALLQRFYQLPDESSQQPKPAAARPTKRRRRRRQFRHGIFDDDNEPHETPEEQAERRRKARQKADYRVVQKRWAHKAIDLGSEVDYGGAVEHMARLVCNQKKKQTVRPPLTEEPSSRNAVAALATADEDGMSSSSDEERQQKALGSLWTSMSQPSEQQSQEQSQAEQKSLPKQPSRDPSTMDYWQLGYAAPRWKDMGDFYYHGNEDVFPGINWDAKRKRAKEIDQAAVSLPPTQPTYDAIPEPRYYVGMAHPTECWANPKFFHRRAFRTLAFRYMIGSVAVEDDETSQRMLHHLTTQSHREVGREYLLMQHAKQRGLDLVLFQSHQWTQRSVAARHLGLRQEDQAIGPPLRVGYTLERAALTNMAQTQRSRLVRLFGDGKIPELREKSSQKLEVQSIMQEAGKLNDDDSVENLGSEAEPVNEDSEEDDDEPDAEASAIPPVLDNDLDDNPGRTKVLSSSALDDKDDSPDDSYFVAFLSRDCDYIHNPGTTPPVPSFPLDETNTIFGGPDKNSRLFYNGKMDEATFTVILSSLLARLWRQKDASSKAQSRIITFLDEVASSNVLGLSQMNPMRRKRTEQPSKLYYMALMGLCSFLANSNCDHSTMDPSEEPLLATLGSQHAADSDDEIDPPPAECASNSPPINVVARLLYERCKACPDSTRLTQFPRIHISTGLALIAKNLPPAAAEILSRSLDEAYCRTPFDLVRKTLEYLEVTGLLVESQIVDESGSLLTVGHLEHIFHQASTIWQSCIEMESSEMEHHGWYISGLAASLLLCSGNRVCSRAYICPSTKRSDGKFEVLFSGDGAEGKCAPHEVRQKLPKFDEVRNELAAAIRKMVDTAETHKFSRLHLGLSSLLEWKQVVALLVGLDGLETGMSPEPWGDVRRLHAHHTVQWAIAEQSLLSLSRVEELKRRRVVTGDVSLSILASMLENDPGDVSLWRRLVTELGPVAVQVKKRRRRECRRTKCLSCQRLRRGLNVDHEALSRRKSMSGWWGETRTSWWGLHLLSIPKSTRRLHKVTVLRISRAVEERLLREMPDPVLSHSSDNEGSALCVGVRSAPDLELALLQRKEPVKDETRTQVHQGNGQSHVADAELPTPSEDLLGEKPQKAEPLNPLIPELCPNGRELEVLCYKLVIACHLYDASHELVREGLWLLAQGSCRKDEIKECSEWRCLLWLAAWGLNVPQILHDLYSSSSL